MRSFSTKFSGYCIGPGSGRLKHDCNSTCLLAVVPTAQCNERKPIVSRACTRVAFTHLSSYSPLGGHMICVWMTTHTCMHACHAPLCIIFSANIICVTDGRCCQYIHAAQLWHSDMWFATRKSLALSAWALHLPSNKVATVLTGRKCGSVAGETVSTDSAFQLTACTQLSAANQTYSHPPSEMHLGTLVMDTREIYKRIFQLCRIQGPKQEQMQMHDICCYARHRVRNVVPQHW